MNRPYHPHPIWGWLETTTQLTFIFGLIWLGADHFDGEVWTVIGSAIVLYGRHGYREWRDGKREE